MAKQVYNELLQIIEGHLQFWQCSYDVYELVPFRLDSGSAIIAEANKNL